MQLEAKKHLEDMRRAMELPAQFTAGRNVDDYRDDPMLASAVERQFETIGEALNRFLTSPNPNSTALELVIKGDVGQLRYLADVRNFRTSRSLRGSTRVRFATLDLYGKMPYILYQIFG